MDAVIPVVKQQEKEDDDDDDDDDEGEGCITKTLRCSPYVDSVIYQNNLGCLTFLLGQLFGCEWDTDGDWKSILEIMTAGNSILKKMSGERVMLSIPHNERVNVDLEDGLSSLPEDLRKHILSLLPIQNAIRTCILSKKWRYTYQPLPNLVFDSLQFVDGESRLDHFAEFIDQTLLHHDDSDIATIKFKLLRERSHVPMTKWIDFAVKHNVQDLVIEAPAVEPGLFSSYVFSSTTLKRFIFSANNHVLGRPTTINLPNLKELCLRGVIFTDDDLIEDIFLSCPVLEHVHLRHCDLSCLKVLNISALRKMEIHLSASS